MTKLSAVWIYGCVAAFLGVSVDCGAIGYPGQAALLAYSPARGEFPVASVFGRGFFSYIDEDGNSRIVSLEATPLHGVRIDAEGRPVIEIGRSIDLAKQELCEREKVKTDKLKPIKEFDERPFQDSLADKDDKLPDLEEELIDPRNPLEAPTTNEIAGQAKQLFVFPSDIPQRKPTEKPAPSQVKPEQDPITEEPALSLPNPQPPAIPPVSGTPGRPGQTIPNLSSPTHGPVLSLSYLPPNLIPGPVFLNPENPFLPQSMQSTPPNPSTTPRPSVPQKPSTSSPVIMSPSTSGTLPSPAALPTTTARPSFAPGNPFLPTPSSVSAFPSSSPPPPVISTPRPPSLISPPRPPPKNPFLSPDKSKKPRPAPVKPTPQFNADKMNPFLPSLGPQPTAPPKLSSPHLEANNIPVQVMDTPEVEQAKREHFLAHQMALAQLQLVQQQDNLKRDETSSISSSPKPPYNDEAVTSGHPMTVTPEPSEDSSLATDAVPLISLE